MDSKTAVLVFANSPEIDTQRKNILHGKKLFENFNKNLIQRVKRSQLPYVVISDKFQKGSNFGERFYNAINHVFNLGFDQVITIGNDTPQLQTKHIIQAHEALEQNKIILGPSADGGFYILGIDKNTFYNLNFKDFDWQTYRLFDQIKSALHILQKQVDYFETLNDIDDFQSLKYIQNFIHKISAQIQKLISILFRQLSYIYLCLTLVKSGISSCIPFNKGSPKVKFDCLS